MKKKYYLKFLAIVLLAFVACRPVAMDDKLEEEPQVKIELEDGSIKEIGIENYIEGVVAAEMQPDWPENAYSAQAIKARTFALKWLEENEIISAKHEEAQAYNPEEITAYIKDAVDKTRGEVATYNGEYIKAWFHSSAAGQTTSAQVGLAYKDDEPPYIVSVESPDELAPDDIKNWKVEIDNEKIAVALQEAGEEAEDIEEINILSSDDTGRIIDIEIIHSNGRKELKGAEFRTLVGPDNLKSILIKNIEKKDTSFEFDGSGWGHGVGMSQWGAKKLAQDGKSPEEIIKYYFKDVEIVKKWE